MVKVTNGIDTISIPEGAVKVYKNMGFRPVGGKATKEVEPVVVEQLTSEESTEVGIDYIEELLQKPISQWNQDEVKEFAAAKGYDVSGAKSLKQAKAIIKDALDEEEKAEVE